ncbi:MAG: hypothetical protein ABSC06_05845, partial [Rhodopila sp.]
GLNARSKCRFANPSKATNPPPQIAATGDQPSKAGEFLPRIKHLKVIQPWAIMLSRSLRRDDHVLLIV